MTPRRRRILAVAAVGLLLLTVSAYIVWQTSFTSHSVVQATSPESFTSHSVVQATSPDGRYVAKVSSTFGLSTNHFDIKVVDNKGQLVRHLAVDDRLPGWWSDPSIVWASDGRTVTVGLEDPDAGTSIKRIAIDMP